MQKTMDALMLFFSLFLLLGFSSPALGQAMPQNSPKNWGRCVFNSYERIGPSGEDFCAMRFKLKPDIDMTLCVGSAYANAVSSIGSPSAKPEAWKARLEFVRSVCKFGGRSDKLG